MAQQRLREDLNEQEIPTVTSESVLCLLHHKPAIGCLGKLRRRGFGNLAPPSYGVNLRLDSVTKSERNFRFFKERQFRKQICPIGKSAHRRVFCKTSHNKSPQQGSVPKDQFQSKFLWPVFDPRG
jgi:CDGSH-type Zn-finger protein